MHTYVRSSHVQPKYIQLFLVSHASIKLEKTKQKSTDLQRDKQMIDRLRHIKNLRFSEQLLRKWKDKPQNVRKYSQYLCLIAVSYNSYNSIIRQIIQVEITWKNVLFNLFKKKMWLTLKEIKYVSRDAIEWDTVWEVYCLTWECVVSEALEGSASK